jgi:hypothetical protein
VNARPTPETPETVAGGGDPDGRRPRHRKLVVLLSALAILAAPAGAFGWRASQGSTIPLAQGDIAKVTGAPIGCIVRKQAGYPALDCRRIGPLAGSYGTILTGRKVLVVRFENQRTAKVVFSARHSKLGVHTCG